MKEWLFNPPWYAPVLLAGVALVLLYQGVQTTKKNLKIAGLATAVLAVGWIVLSAMIETDREVVERQTRELATAVNDRDWAKFKSLLDPKVTFYAYSGRDQLTQKAEQSADIVGVKDIVVSGIDVTDEPGGCTATFMATATVNEGRQPTNWKFSWAKDPSGKELLYRIDVLPSIGVSPDQITGRLVK